GEGAGLVAPRERDEARLVLREGQGGIVVPRELAAERVSTEERRGGPHAREECRAIPCIPEEREAPLGEPLGWNHEDLVREDLVSLLEGRHAVLHLARIVRVEAREVGAPHHRIARGRRRGVAGVLVDHYPQPVRAERDEADALPLAPDRARAP